MKIYNTMSRQKEDFQPIGREVGLYTCGPTVYNYAHLGNMRAYLNWDILKRVLRYLGYDVKHIVNITDVGHLAGDGDMGEDKLEKGAAREGRTAWEVAEFYTQAFFADCRFLHILEADVYPRVTDHIPEQIELIRILEEKGYTYRTSDGIYYDTSKFPEYNKLSKQAMSELEEGARVEVNPEKRHPTDFALWKFSPTSGLRHMEWDSPWGVGFPGWHIECSALCMKYLAGQMDIHGGGIDHISVHHTNEIAQSEAASGEKFFNYWMHSAFLNIEGGKKMAKSGDNFLTLKKAFIEKGFSPLVYRFMVLTTHYHKSMEYSEEAVINAANAFKAFLSQVRMVAEEAGASPAEPDVLYQARFRALVEDDLAMPQALALAQELLRSDLSPAVRWATILDFDRVLGFDLATLLVIEIPANISLLLERRQAARQAKDWTTADALRQEIAEAGYTVEDSASEQRVYKS